MPTVDLPVYLYDVVTASDAPRFVVSCRTAEAAQQVAVRLNQLRTDGLLAGDEHFTAAEPRIATVTLPVTPGAHVIVQGYCVATEAVAVALNQAQGRAP
jgi:hypothetical protein